MPLVTEPLVTPTGVLVYDGEPLTPEWFDARREGITGTDLPKLLGLSRYGNALSVWLDKRGELDDEDAGEAAEWGQILEEPVASEWAERHSTIVQRVGVLAHTDRTWQRVSLDRLVIECPDNHPINTPLKGCGLEVKTRSAFVKEAWRDGIPDDVLSQVQWGLDVTGLDHMHVAALIGGQRLVSFRVDRDPSVMAYQRAEAQAVWQAVEDGVPPEAEPDAEGLLLGLLDRLYSHRSGRVELDPDAAERWVEQYRAGHDIEAEGKRLKVEAKTALVQMLDDGEVGTIDDAPLFVYRRPRPRQVISADNLRRMRRDFPTFYDALKTGGLITTTEPEPRFTLSKRSTTEETP